MSDTMHSFVEEKMRLGLTGEIPASQLDSLVPQLTTLFKILRPSLRPEDVFIAISAPSICGYHHCCCNSIDCRLNKYKITIFVERREQGRRVNRPWIRAASNESFGDAVSNLMAMINESIQRFKPETESVRRNKSATCLVELLLD